MDYRHPEYLTTPAALAAALDDPGLRVLDATVFLEPAKNGYRAVSGRDRYDAGHVPGAVFMDQIDAFSDRSSGLGFTLPAPERLADAFGTLGVSRDTPVVIYASGHIMWATRAWWLLHYLGHDRVAVLNGGFRRWRDEGFPVSTDPASYPAADFAAAPRPDVFLNLDGMSAALQAKGVCTVNALSPEMYAGTAEMNYGRPGHIPGSRNLHYERLLDDGNFKSADDLAAALDEAGMLDAERVVTYCGGGISATIDAFACLLVGKGEVAVYDGSMSEWVRDESRPLKVGTDP